MAPSDEGTILLAEDRDDDIILIQLAFKKSDFPGRVAVVRDGDEAIRYLSGADRFADRNLYPLPALLLLDLKLPLVDGFAVLRWIRAQLEHKDLPVIVLTLSNRIRDINEAYALGAYSFLIKTTDFKDAVAFSKSLAYYWSNIKTDGRLKIPAASWPAKENVDHYSGTQSCPEPQHPSE